MTPKLQSKLFEKYPKIFKQKDLPVEQTSMCWGIDIGDGWYHIIDTLCRQIQNHLKHNLKKDQNPKLFNVEVTQIKEKFGGLCFYYSGGDEFIEGLVWMAEGISNKTCEECAAYATQNDTGWVHTLCNNCRESKMKKTITRLF